MAKLSPFTVDRLLERGDDDRSFSDRPRPLHGSGLERRDPVGARRAPAPGASATPTPDLPWTRPVGGGVPVLGWVHPLEGAAWRQIERVARLPFLFPKGLALMPDAHVGNGACVGSVLPMRGALVPSAVGVDLGCGMMAVRLDLRAGQLPDHLKPMRRAIEAAVPLGSGGAHGVVSPRAAAAWEPLRTGYERISTRNPGLVKRKVEHQLGTLGAGNHFIEVCLDEGANVWVVLHSGSRGIGALIGQRFIDRARRRAVAEGLILPEANLGWFDEGSPDFEAYHEAMMWAQDYAMANRQVMMGLTLDAVAATLGRSVRVTGEAINCHHNYVARETHFGEDLWVTRKGAIRAGVGEWGIVPGSMGAESFIVRGRGAAEAYCSCAHGAGRAMSRTAARERFTAHDLKRQTSGVECKKDRSLVDEAPGAYKPIREVMAQQKDLVEVVHTLRQVVCVKGA